MRAKSRAILRKNLAPPLPGGTWGDGMTTSLYRHFADDGALLYVGISLSWPTRTKAHVRGSRWFDQVAKVEIERFPTREAALDAEREAIRRECPRYNVIHNRRRPKASVGSERNNARPFRGDPLLQAIKGPDAIVGPALVYRDDLISMMVAHGEFGTAGDLTEIVLGRHFPETPEWAQACTSVISIRHADQMTIAEAREMRREIVRKLERHLGNVEAFDTDLSMAVAYASRFPSKKSRQVLEEVAVEREAHGG